MHERQRREADAARIVEKVRVNPGNYVDKKKFELIEYTDAEYNEEIDRIRQRFTPLVKICKEYGTAMRIGTNHGSLSDRIMSRYGDTPMGMVESAMEFLRVARGESYHNIVLSMKSSNPLVMVQAYRLLIRQMEDEFGVIYPLHLGVTEAGDGEDGIRGDRQRDEGSCGRQDDAARDRALQAIMRELVEMHYLQTTPVLMDDSALAKLLGNVKKTPYAVGVKECIRYLQR